MPFAAACLDLEMMILSEVNKRKTNIICYHLYVQSKKNDTNEHIKNKQTQRQRK